MTALSALQTKILEELHKVSANKAIEEYDLAERCTLVLGNLTSEQCGAVMDELQDAMWGLRQANLIEGRVHDGSYWLRGLKH